MAHPSSRSCFPYCAAAVLLVFLVSLSGCGNNDVGTAQSVVTLAGAAGGPGFFDGTGTLVRFSAPSGVAVVGASLFVTDAGNHVIRKIDTATGSVTTLAGTSGIPGSADGTGAAARFNAPTGIVTDGTFLFVCDTGNHTIRKVVAASGQVTTLAGAPGTAGSTDNVAGPGNVLFSSPKGLAIAAGLTGTPLIVADTGNHKIRRVSLAGAATTYAGSGSPGFTDNNVATGASFRSPEGVAAFGTDVYVADTGNHTVRKILSSGAVGGNVTTLAGTVTIPGFVDNVAGLSARFSSPSSLVFVGTDLFVADTGNHAVRKIDTSASTAFVTTLAGTPGSAGFTDTVPGPAQFNGPKGIGILGTGASTLFVADTGNDTIRQVTLAGTVATVAGNPPRTGVADGTGTSARFDAPAGAAIVGDDVYVADTGNGAIRKITASGEVTTVPGTVGPFASPAGIAAIGSTLYVCDNVNHTISSVPAGGGTVTVLAGLTGSSGSLDGAGTAARFSAPGGIATDGKNLFVADTGNHTIRQVTPSGDVTTLAGQAGSAGSADGSGGGINPAARFNAPRGIAVTVASLATTLYVADTANHAIRRVSGTGSPNVTVTTFAGTAGTAGHADGTGESARFSSPAGITAVDGVLFAADAGNHVVRRIETTRKVTTFVGAPDEATTRDGDAPQALLNAPAGMAGAAGTIVFTDRNENVVRKILF